MKINKANKIYTSGYSKLLNSNNFERMIPSEIFVRMYKFFINNNKRLNCLDFGVGDGRHFHYLLDKKHKVTGTDISEERLSLCKKDLNFFF
jgi:2-polyprenyl-3-methyl-5-hydroxy-6-metoxy-1,4-benzoquinol methylase